MGENTIEFLEKHLSPQTFGLLLLCGSAIFIWFQHLRNKLLREQLEFEKDKRETFLKELQELKNAPPPNLSKLTNGKTSKRILIVDDEPWLRSMLALCLSQEYPNFQIEEAADGVEALKTFASGEPCILITDAMMPRLDGFELIAHLQQQDKMVPTLMISGYVSSGSFEEMLSTAKVQKNDDIRFLSKPFTIEELLKSVDALMKRKHHAG